MTDITKLIAELEQVECGSRELDARIHVSIGGEDTRGDDRLTEFVVPHYTTSIDAALPGEKIKCVINLEDNSIVLACGVNGETHHGHAKTEPLARRIAALKARQAA